MDTLPQNINEFLQHYTEYIDNEITIMKKNLETIMKTNDLETIEIFYKKLYDKVCNFTIYYNLLIGNQKIPSDLQRIDKLCEKYSTIHKEIIDSSQLIHELINDTFCEELLDATCMLCSNIIRNSETLIESLELINFNYRSIIDSC